MWLIGLPVNPRKIGRIPQGEKDYLPSSATTHLKAIAVVAGCPASTILCSFNDFTKWPLV
jgi:hypothetical protein